MRIFSLLVLMLFPFVLIHGQDCTFTSGAQLRAYLKHNPKRAQPLIMAHRGGPAAGYPENAMPTFARTLAEVPCPLMEFDVRMTKDSMLVLMHDNNLAIGTNGEGKLNKKNWESVRNLRLKGVDGKASTYTIPTLEEFLRWAKDKPLILVADAKPGTDIRRVAAELDSRGVLAKSILVCYSIEDAQKIHRLKPDLTLALGFNSVDAVERIAKSGLPMDHLVALAPRPKTPLQANYYAPIHQYGIPCSLGTDHDVDKLPMTEAAAQYRNRFDAGADIICTDRPVEVYGVFGK